ncbi:hypothetical protein GOBAR_AA08037 [Gossypium barbadense]|uniref:Uncharacterized protein n=1 Tax=Gossypium barbadense TaxID=3634 RepID=A0A2P5YAH6_GOSBA|nr:hypothetical protein GOBAR_AA08037 [Gossypium barbadense]
MMNPKGKKVAVPASKKLKGATSSSSPTAEIRHPFLQFPPGPQEELFLILRARPLALRPIKGIYDPSRSKALALALALRYLHALPVHTLTGSMLYMRMIERHRGFNPPQYRLARATDEDDAEDIPDDIPAFQEDPPSQPPLSHQAVYTATSLSEVSDHFHHFE